MVTKKPFCRHLQVSFPGGFGCNNMKKLLFCDCFLCCRIQRLVRRLLLSAVFPGLRLRIHTDDCNRQDCFPPSSLVSPALFFSGLLLFIVFRPLKLFHEKYINDHQHFPEVLRTVTRDFDWLSPEVVLLNCSKKLSIYIYIYTVYRNVTGNSLKSVKKVG